jgi:hypothetical protein
MVGDKNGRNDPCPCGSGKKYKNCCLFKEQKKRLTPVESFKVTPREKPKIIDYYLESNGSGTGWIKRPGKLMFRVDIRPAEEIDEEIEKLFKDRLKNFPLKYELDVAQHKLYAVRYHMNNLIFEEQTQVKKFEKDYIPPGGAEVNVMNSKLIFEMESFLFQVKSSLDILAVRVLNKILEHHLKKFGTDEETKQILQSNISKIGEQKVNKLISILEKSKDWIEELNRTRAQITHYSNLEGFLCFLRMPFTGGEECIIYYPSMPDGTRATTYMKSIWKNLLSLYESILSAAYS